MAQRAEQTAEILLLVAFCVLVWVVVRCPGVIVYIGINISQNWILIPRTRIAIGISLTVVLNNVNGVLNSTLIAVDLCFDFFLTNSDMMRIVRRLKVRKRNPKQVGQVLQHCNMRVVQVGEWVKEAGGEEDDGGGTEVGEHDGIATLF